MLSDVFDDKFWAVVRMWEQFYEDKSNNLENSPQQK